MHRAETVKRAAAIKRGQVTQAKKRRDRVILYSALVALRWLLYAGCSTLFFVITLVLLCFGSTLFWLYGACSLRFPYLRHEPPQNLHQISTYRISTASLPNLCRIYTLNVLHASILSLCAELWAAGLAVQRVPLFATVVCLACLAT